MNLLYFNSIHLRYSKLCDGYGVFANKDFKKGELIEQGVASVLNNVDGNENPHLFTWSNEIPNLKWAVLSGYAFYYNTSLENKSNTIMIRDFKNNTFKIYAKKNIIKDEELLHTYKSLSWRKCFQQMNLSIHSD